MEQRRVFIFLRGLVDGVYYYANGNKYDGGWKYD